MELGIEAMCALYAERGHASYQGEPVSQLEHALQSARLAERAGAAPALVAAAFLHDLGHLLAGLHGTPTLRGVDDRHQELVLPFLEHSFSREVLDPIRLHVDAKRYLCATRPLYLEALSADSRRSLDLQGGAFSASECAAFLEEPFAEDAIRLRRWDDAAKARGAPTPDLSHYAAVLRSCARPSSR